MNNLSINLETGFYVKGYPCGENILLRGYPLILFNDKWINEEITCP